MILVIGGSGSGKSAYAEKVALECQKEKRHFYLATMHVFGEEGQKKVERHKRMRAGKGFVTIEQPTDIMQCLPALREAGGGVVLLECMSNLAANEMFDTEEPAGSEQVAEKIVTQIGVLAQETEELVIVTNNVFEDGDLFYLDELSPEEMLAGMLAEIEGTPDPTLPAESKPLVN